KGMAVDQHWTVEDGLPDDQVRALAPAPNGVWAATLGGLARIDLDDGVVQTWTREDGLDDTLVNGIGEIDGILYLSTLSGLFRLDTDTGEILDLVETSGEFGSVPASMRIAYPPSGSVIKAPINVTGTAAAPGRTIERIEVRVDDGAWLTADGTAAWEFRLPVDEMDRGEHTITARVIAGGEPAAEVQRVIQVDKPAPGELVPPTFEHTPPEEAVKGEVLVVEGTIEGEDPLDGRLTAWINGEEHRALARIAGGQATFTLRIPDDATGEVTYKVRVQSASGQATFPETGRFEVPVKDPRVRGFDAYIEDLGNGTLAVEAGETRTLNGWVNNTGNRAENVHLSVSGLRASWLDLNVNRLIVPPGERVGFEATLTVPDDARTRSQAVIVNINTADGELTANIPMTLEVTGQAIDEPEEDGGNDTPAPGVSLLVGILGTLAVVTARARREAR
ncbi:MAG: Ig-like domain-containing protein, partial [Candidatus Thermoplasmatota archaeon]|nr:Ig-like domain-containing protein [Candidatus Thermoplasmatota archaeon]